MDAGQADPVAPDAAIVDAGDDVPDSGQPDSGVIGSCSVPSRPGAPSGFSGPAPVVYYTFDDDHREAGAVLNAIGPDLDATPNADVGLGIDGPVGQAASFDGARALMTSEPPKSDTFSVALWVRPRVWPDDERRVIINLGNGPSAWQGWGVTIRPSGVVRGFVEGGGSVANEHVAPTESCVPPGLWVHIAMTMDGENLRLYANGVFQSATPVNLPTVDFGSVGLVLGYHSFFQNAYYDGDVDEVALWDQALSEEEVAEVYFAGRDGVHFVCPTRCGDVAAPGESIPASGLVGWYRADRGVGQGPLGAICAWCDLSSADHDLTQPDVAGRPDGRGLGIEGAPTLRFEGTTRLFRPGTLSIESTAGRTFAAVYRPYTLDQRTVIFRMGRNGTPGTYLMIESNTFQTVGQRFGVYVTNNAYDSGTATSTLAPSVHVMRLSTMQVGIPVLDALGHWVDGVQQTLVRTPGGLGNRNIEVFDATETSVGWFGSNIAVPGGADISEVLVYDRPLDDVERQELEAYLLSRYAP